MKKICYYMLMCLTLCFWSCKDDVPVFGPQPDTVFDIDVFVDPRDGKQYHTITIGDQTWMVENFAFRLDSGSWAGCYTYDELKTNDLDTMAIFGAIPKPGPDLKLLSFDVFWAEVEAAMSDGRISNDVDQWGFFTPAMNVDFIKQYVDMGYIERSVDAFMNDPVYGVYAFVSYSDEDMQQAVIGPLEDIINGMTPDPFDVFKSLVEEAKADGRISSDILPDDDWGYMSPSVIVDMFLPSATSIEQFMELVDMYVEYYPSLNELLIPVLNAIVDEVNAETADEIWPPADLKAEALAAAVKAAQDNAFLQAEIMNGYYSEKYGLLYTLDAARKAVPEGWRIPTDEDWKKLELALGLAAGELDRLETWRGNAFVSDWFKSKESGFGLVYGGTRAYNSLNGSSLGKVFMNKDLKSYFLTDTQIRQNDSVYYNVIRIISSLQDGIYRGTSHVTAAHSLRLIKDTGRKKDDDIIDGSGMVIGDAMKE